MKKLKTVDHIKVKKGMSVAELVEGFQKAGVMGAGKIGKAVDILKKMTSEKNCTVFFGIAGAMVPGGQKQVIIDMIRSRKIHVMVTTGAMLTHDLVEALGYRHYTHEGEKFNDAELRKQKLDRMYDSLMPDTVYEGLEDFIVKNFGVFSKCKSIKDLLMEIGRLIWTLEV